MVMKSTQIKPAAESKIEILLLRQGSHTAQPTAHGQMFSEKPLLDALLHSLFPAGLWLDCNTIKECQYCCATEVTECLSVQDSTSIHLNFSINC